MLDSDTNEELEIEYESKEIERKIRENRTSNISYHFAVPELESWIAAGLDEKIYKKYSGIISKEQFKQNFLKPGTGISSLLKKSFRYDQAMSISSGFHSFVEDLLDSGKR